MTARSRWIPQVTLRDGLTDSYDFPTTPDAFQTSYHLEEDAFASKLNADGSALLYSTFLGGDGEDEGYGIAVDASGKRVCCRRYVQRSRVSNDLPTTTGSLQPRTEASALPS